MNTAVTEEPQVTPQWRDYEKFVAKLAWQSQRRYLDYGVLMDIDDLIQEGAVAFVRATRTFDPARGFKFITYCGAAVSTALTRYKQKMDRQLVGATTSLDTALDPESDPYEVIGGEDSCPLDRLILESDMQALQARLGPLGAQMIDWLINPPAEIEAELEALRWKFNEMARQGLRRNVHSMDMDVRFLLGELLPRVIPDNQAAIKRLRADVQGAVDAWKI